MKTFYPGCKLNLGLRILDKRPDGKHNLESLFLPLAWPCDVLRIAQAPATKFSLKCAAPIAGKNILVKTWEQFGNAAGLWPGAQIELTKRIPMGAGLGGGSADAACLLDWLNQYARLPRPELIKIAGAIGADVPFFLFNKFARVTGAGEHIAVLPEMARPFWLILIWPEIMVNTGWAFAALDASRQDNFLLTNRRNEASGFFPFQEDLGIFENDLEKPVFAEYPVLAEIRQNLLNLGANHAAMSGSGSTIYGLFFVKRQAGAAFAKLRASWRNVFLLSGNTGQNMAEELITGM